MATFEGIQHIGHKVFSFLSVEEHLKFRLVCESWKIIAENPIYWLQKLENIGQPKNISKKWLQLLEKAKESGISESKVANLMILKYHIFKKQCNKRLGFYYRVNVKYEIQIDFPPIYQALYSKPEDLEVLKLLMDIDKRSFILPKECSPHFWITPLVEAINMDANTEVIKCVASKMSNPFRAFNDASILHLAIRKSNVEVCKYFVERAPKKVFTKGESGTHQTPLELAFSMENLEIIKCLALNSPIEHVDETLFKALFDYSKFKAPVKCKQQLLEKINIMGSILQDSKLSLNLCDGLNFPLTDSDNHKIVAEYLERVRKRVQELENP